MGDSLADHRLVAEAVAAPAPTADEVRHALSLVDGVRRDLDRVERELIGTARELGLGWLDIAAALGVGTRQAAEQRWLRLRGGSTRDPVRVRAARRTQRSVDTISGLGDLRRAAHAVHRRLEADPGWDDRHRRAALVRTSLAAALDAPPGALYAMCRNALDDLDAMSAVRLPAVIATAVRRLRGALDTLP